MKQAWIDLHTHIAWGVDDGIATFEETCQVLATAQRDGAETIVLTPHYIPGRYDMQTHKQICERMKECRDVAKTYQIQIEFGSEIFLNQDYLQMLEDKNFNTLGNSNYILVEFDVRKDLKQNKEVEDQLYECIIRGYIPIIAHVERYFHHELDVERVKKWIEMGCFIQVNRSSLVYKKPKHLYHNALTLLKLNLVHIIASDTHEVHGRRICKLSDVYQVLVKECGEENARVLCYENAKHILKQEPLESMQPYKRSLLDLFRR